MCLIVAKLERLELDSTATIATHITWKSYTRCCCFCCHRSYPSTLPFERVHAYINNNAFDTEYGKQREKTEIYNFQAKGVIAMGSWHLPPKLGNAHTKSSTGNNSSQKRTGKCIQFWAHAKECIMFIDYMWCGVYWKMYLIRFDTSKPYLSIIRTIPGFDTIRGVCISLLRWQGNKKWDFCATHTHSLTSPSTAWHERMLWVACYAMHIFIIIHRIFSQTHLR